jgi:ubiquinone biosynthesis protein Coq4
LHTKAALADPFEDTGVDPELEARWQAFFELPAGTLGRTVASMYEDRGFQLPGSRGAASAYLAQHDFVHVLSEYGTAMESELEVFGFLGRADPDPKGFAWLATMIGLFDTGRVHAQGPFAANVRERHLHTPGMDVRLADAIRRGKVVCEGYGVDLFTVDFHSLTDRPIEDVRELLGIPPKSDAAIAAGSPGVFDPAGMSEFQRAAGARARADRVDSA